MEWAEGAPAAASGLESARAVGVPAVCDGRASRTGEGEMSDERGGSVGVGSSRRLFVGRRTAVRRGGRSRGAARGGK